MGRIRFIRVGKVKSMPNYTSVKLEVEEELNETDVPRDVILRLSKWIDERIQEVPPAK